MWLPRQLDITDPDTIVQGNNMPPPLVQPMLPPAGRGNDARIWLETVGLVPFRPCIRSTDVTYLSKPQSYYLERRLGIAPAFNSSDSSSHGTWAHARANLPRQADPKVGMQGAFKKWVAQSTATANTLGMGTSALQGFIEREKTRWMEAWTWYEAARTVKIPGDLPGGLDSIYDNHEYRSLGTELVLCLASDCYSGSRSVVQLDRLSFQVATNQIWIDDYKFTGGSRKARALSCPVEYQTRHYLAVVRGSLQSIIAKYRLPETTSLGGMRHVIIGTPALSFGMKDRKYRWVSEGKRSGRSGRAQKGSGGWDVFYERDQVDPAVSGYEEDEAVRTLHGYTGKAPEKEFLGEPDQAMYRKRIESWYNSYGDYVGNEVEFSTDPVILVSRTSIEAFDEDAQIEYEHLTQQIYDLATMGHPCPVDYPRTGRGMNGEYSISPSHLAEFYVQPVSEWPRLMREKLLVIRPRDGDLWNAAETGILETA